MNKFYVTTGIAYVNAKPHIGFAFESLLTDVIARYHRYLGDEVFFLTGTDEHGMKILQAAREAKKEPQAFVDEVSVFFKDLKGALDLSTDSFMRTTAEFHKRGARELWKACAKDIYRAEYEGIYCVGCEEYKTEQELAGGRCPEHPNAVPERLKEANYFFALSKYEDRITAAVERGELGIYPESRKNEVLAFLKRGLKDVPISRPKARLPWGIPVPDDPDHVMYVWFDALPNYITGVGYGDPERKDVFAKWWPADLHVIGKGIWRFHAAMWPGMLLSAGLPLPKMILIHGYVNIAGQKISKSLGNVVDPLAFAQTYGTDPLRYYLLREIPTTGDGDFSMERFLARYNNELADDLGNLVQRVAAMIERYVGGKPPARVIGPADTLKATQNLAAAKKEAAQFQALMNGYRLGDAFGFVWEKVRGVNHYIEEEKPWEVAKKAPDRIEMTLGEIVTRILDITPELAIFLPETSRRIIEIFTGETVQSGAVLFPKIDADAA